MTAWRLTHPAWLQALPIVLLVMVLLELRVGGGPARWGPRIAVRALLLATLLLALAGPVATRVTSQPPALRVLVAEVPSAPRVLAEAEAGAAAWRARAAQRELAVESARVGPTLHEALLDAAARPEAWRGGVVVLGPAQGLHGDAPAGESDALPAQLEAARAQLRMLRARGVHVRFQRVPAARRPEVAPQPRVTAWSVPDAPTGAFQVRARIEDLAGAHAVVQVGERVFTARPAPSDPVQDIEGDLVWELPALPTGTHELTLGIQAPNAVTPLRRHLLEVPRQRSLASLSPSHTPAVFLRAAKTQGLTLTAWRADATPRPALLHATPTDLLAQSRQGVAAIGEAVRGGMGLVVEAGADDTQWAALARSPWRNLLALHPEATPAPPPETPPPTQEPKEPPREAPKPAPGPGLTTEVRPDQALPVSLVLVLDCSASMAGDKFAMALEAARRAARALAVEDRLGIVTFGEGARLALRVRSLRGRDPTLFLMGVQADQRETNIYAALRVAGRALLRERSPIRHLILLTDGAQVPPGPLFESVVRPLGEGGITITAVGIGEDAEMGQLREIVRHAAGGMTLYAPHPSRIPTVVTRDTQGVVSKRNREAEARGLLRPKDAPPGDAPEVEAPGPTPPPEASGEGARTPPDPAPEAPARRALLRLRRHEALTGLAEQTLPDVGPPRRAELAAGAVAVLGVAAEGAGRRDRAFDPVLAVARRGLGRVAVWALPPNDAGWASYGEGARALTQVLRAACASRASGGDRPTLTLLPMQDVGVTNAADEGPVLEVAWPPGIEDDVLHLELSLADGAPTALPARLVASYETQHLVLPVPPATPFRVTGRVRGEVVGHVLGWTPAKREVPVRTASQSTLDALSGSAPPDAEAWLDALPAQERLRRVPRWPWCIWVALGLLLVDAALHRRRNA